MPILFFESDVKPFQNMWLILVLLKNSASCCGIPRLSWKFICWIKPNFYVANTHGLLKAKLLEKGANCRTAGATAIFRKRTSVTKSWSGEGCGW